MPRLPGRLGTLTARDVMTERLVVLHEADLLPHAAQVLREQRISGAPVVNASGEVAGMLSLSDLIGHGQEPWLSSSSQADAAFPNGWSELCRRVEQSASAQTVADRMTRNVMTVWEATPITEVARILCDGHWHRVPVISAAGKLTGIVSAMDLLAALVQAQDEAGI